MNPPAVVVDSLAKTYPSGSRSGREPVHALVDLSFTAPAAKVTAILGPNGAGKTTAIEICEGFRRTDSGAVRVLGRPPGDPALRARVGVMPQSGGTYQAATVAELVGLFASFYAHPLPVGALLDRLSLAALSKRTVKRLSGGEAQRLSLALALVGRPELVFLDEPTASLDVHARRDTWDLIAELRTSGVAVVLTTHYIEEAESLADHVVIVDAGSAIASGTPRSLVGEGLTITFEADRLTEMDRPTSDEISPATLAGLNLPSGVQLRETRPGSFVVEGAFGCVIDTALAARVTSALAAAGPAVRHLRVTEATLESAFLALTGRGWREES